MDRDLVVFRLVKVTFTASGNISNGDTVIVNSNGTVSVVAEAVASSPTIGDNSAFHSVLIPFQFIQCMILTRIK